MLYTCIAWPLCVWLVSTSVARADEDDNPVDNYQSQLHADLPILAKSHFKQWYIYLVVSVLGVMFLISLGIVIRGIYTCVRRKSLLERAASKKQMALSREHDLELGRCPPMNGGMQGVQKVSRMEMLSYKPTPQDDDRLSRRKLAKCDEEAMQVERERRLAQHEKPTETLQALRRLNSL